MAKNNAAAVVITGDADDELALSRRLSKANVQLVREAMKQLIEVHGYMTAKQLLELARPKNSPLHVLFEWDNTKAAENFRLQQAGTFIRCVRFKVLTEDGVCVVPETISVYHEPGRRGYVPTLTVMSDDELAGQAVAEAKEAYLRLRSRYATFKKLAPIHAAIDRTFRKR